MMVRIGLVSARRRPLFLAPLVVGTLLATVYSPAVAQPLCIGDCNNDASVIVNEIITLVSIALGSADASACANGIPSGGVDISLMIQAVNNVFNGCPGGATPLPTATRTPTVATVTPAQVSVSITSEIFTIIPAGAPPASVTAQVSNSSQAVTWSLVEGSPATDCSPGCGTLGTPAVTTNGTTTTSTVQYTPPSSFPGVATDHPTLVATSVADASQSVSFRFRIGNLDSDCGYGNESLLTGHYATLMRGSFGGAPAAEGAVFDLDGKGHVAANVGVADSQGTLAFGLLAFDVQIDPAQSFFSVGADHRGCLTLVTVKGTGSPATSASYEHHFRFALGKINASGVARSGFIQEFDNEGGTAPDIIGTIQRQDTTAFQNSSFNGPYAFGGPKVGGQFGIAGAFVANGSGGSSGGVADYNQNMSSNINIVDGQGPQPTFPGSGLSFNSFTMSIASNGRGTWSFTLSDGSSYNSVVYVISASKLLVLRTDQQISDSSIPLFTAEILKQSKSSFTTSDISGTFVGYTIGFGSVGLQTQMFLATANGSGSFTNFTLYQNNAGTLNAGTETNTGSYTVGSFGRVLISGFSKHSNTVEYLVGPAGASPNGGFIMDSNPRINFGYVEPQTSTAITSPATFAFGTIDADSFDQLLQTGVATFDSGTVTGTSDIVTTTGGGPLIPDNTINLTYTVDATGTGNITQPPGTSCSFTGGTCQSLFIVMSPSKIALMNATAVQEPTITVAEQ